MAFNFCQLLYLHCIYDLLFCDDIIKAIRIVEYLLVHDIYLTLIVLKNLVAWVTPSLCQSVKPIFPQSNDICSKNISYHPREHNRNERRREILVKETS